MTIDPLVLWVVAALAVGAFIPRLLSRGGLKVPQFLMPEEPPLRAVGERVSEEPAVAYQATNASSKPLMECYEWVKRALAGEIDPTSSQLRILTSIRRGATDLLGLGAPAKPVTPPAETPRELP
jgi:hypothetical protein